MSVEKINVNGVVYDLRDVEDVDAERQRAMIVEGELSTGLDSEVLRAKQEETKLLNRIETETSRATQEETKLLSKINSEVSRAKEAEAKLLTKTDAANTYLTIESAEAEHESRLDAEEEMRTAIASNRAERIQADTAITAELDALDDTLNCRTTAILGRISQVSREILNSGESMSLNIPPIMADVTILLRATINNGFSGVAFSIANAVISISKESVRIVIGGEERNIELDWDDYYGEFFQNFIFVDFRLQSNRGIGDCDMCIKSYNNSVDIHVGSLTIPMHNDIAVSVSGSLLTPVLLVDQPISSTVLILDYADRVDYTGNGVTITGYSGITSTVAVALFDSILTRGRPDAAVWFVGAAELDEADSNEIYDRNLDAFVTNCNLYGVRPILCTIPNTPRGLHIGKNGIIRRFSDKAIIADIATFINGSITGVTYPNGFWDAANNTVSEDGITLMYYIINSYL